MKTKRQSPHSTPPIRSVLVVDDDPLILSFMEDLLNGEGYDVMTAVDGLDVLEILKTHTPDAMFIDLIMPGIDGKRLCRIIRKKQAFNDVYIVILSATLAEEPVNMMELGANACIAKGRLADISRNVLLTLREPDMASSRCSSGEILGMENIHPSTMTRQLLSLKKHFERIMEKMSQGVMELSREGTILFANPAALALVPVAEDQLLGSRFVDLFEKDDRQRVEKCLDPFKGSTERGACEAPAALNGKLFSLEILPHADGVTGPSVIMTDVTRRKRQENRLRNKARQLANVIFDNSDAMIVVDGEGIVRLVNSAAEAIFGRESRSLVGAPFGAPVAGVNTVELDVVTRNGEERIVEMRVVETEWEGEPAHLASIRDITERSRMERALEEARRKIIEQQEKLVEEERLKVILQMAGATAHEFNQPLTVLLGNVEMLELCQDDPEVFAELLRDVKTAGTRIADIVKKVQNIRYYETKPYGTGRSSIIDIEQDVRLLSIEDSDSYFEIIETVFKGMEHVHLTRAKTIEGAFSLLTDNDMDLILLDYGLPDGNGFDFLKKALEKGVQTPVVVLTGKGDEMIASRLLRAGADDYLTKAAFDQDSISRIILYLQKKTRLRREIQLARDKMAQMAARDGLTGLYNRRYFFDALEHERKRAKRYGTDLTVCMIDLDHFKRINDIHGHPAGDTVLEKMGKLLKSWARETDLPCRYGGEEFAVLLQETSLEGGRIACERLRRMVAEHRFAHEGRSLNVTISIGVAYYDKTGAQTVSDLIKKADAALYRAKEEGRNRVALQQTTGV